MHGVSLSMCILRMFDVTAYFSYHRLPALADFVWLVGIYIHSASGSRFFGLVVRALDFYQGRPGSTPMTGGKFLNTLSNIFMILGRNVEQAKTTCRVQE